MFDISFSELMVIAVVALIVIGPEKLPTVARTLGTLMGRMQKYVAQVKEEVNREARFEELQQLQQEIKNVANQAQSSLQNATKAMTQQAEALELMTVNQLSQGISDVSDSVPSSIHSATPSAVQAFKTAPSKSPRKKTVSKTNLTP